VPQQLPAWTTALLESEPFHVFAHCVLYGALALLVRRFISRRAVAVLNMVLALGALQELAQVICVRSFGTPELFDLTVDALATVAALKLAVRFERRRSDSASVLRSWHVLATWQA
jgi:hypothetical protein